MSVAPVAAALYPIRAVSRLTGLGIDTLRAWERRHGAVVPVRDDRGRMYTDADIERLRLLRDAVARGHSIGRVASLPDSQLKRLASSLDAVAPAAPPPADSARPDAEVLGAAIRAYDATAIDQEMSRLATVLKPIDLLRHALLPALVQVGDDWHRGKARVGQEHLMSSAIRHLLGAYLRLHVRRDVPARLLFATLSGDRHEIGVLGAALLAAGSGLGVTYLGPDLPAGDIVEGARATKARAVVLGVTTSSRTRTVQELRTLTRQLPREVELWLGGRGASRHTSLVGSRGLVFTDYVAYQQELARLGGRPG